MGDNVPALTWDPGKFRFQRKLGNFVQYFQVNLPTNTYGIPLKLINPLPLAENMLDCETTDDMPEHVVEQAIMSVDFEDGMPVVDGLPLWERLDGELVEYYKYFKEYRDMMYLEGSRAVSKLAAKLGVEGRQLNILSKVYHWQLRCRAYDAHKKVQRERMRQYEIEKLESRHTQASAVLLERGLQYIEDHPEQLNPKIALQMIQVAMKAGRLSLGLNAEKPGAGESAPSISISNTTNTGTQNGDVSTTTNIGGDGGENDKPDVSYLQSIVHILDKSGALNKAKQEVIDVDFEEVLDEDKKDDSAAFEGA